MVWLRMITAAQWLINFRFAEQILWVLFSLLSLSAYSEQQSQQVETTNESNSPAQESADAKTLKQDEPALALEDLAFNLSDSELINALLLEMARQNPNWLFESLEDGRYLITKTYGDFAIFDSFQWLANQMEEPVVESPEKVTLNDESEAISAVKEGTGEQEKASKASPDNQREHIIAEAERLGLELFGLKREEKPNKYLAALRPLIRSKIIIDQYKINHGVKKKHPYQFTSVMKEPLGLYDKAKDFPYVWEPYVGDWIILYVIDLGERKLPLRKEYIDQLSWQEVDVKQQAVANFRKDLPQYYFRGGSDVQMLYSGGLYESSFLLIPEFWNSYILGFDGTPMVFMPAANKVYIVEANDQNAINLVRSAVLSPFNDDLIIGSSKALVMGMDGWETRTFEKLVIRQNITR